MAIGPYITTKTMKSTLLLVRRVRLSIYGGHAFGHSDNSVWNHHPDILIKELSCCCDSRSYWVRRTVQLEVRTKRCL